MDLHKAFASVDHDVLPDRYSPVALALILFINYSLNTAFFYFYARAKLRVVATGECRGCDIPFGLNSVGKSANYRILIKLDRIVSFCQHLSCRQIANKNFI